MLAKYGLAPSRRRGQHFLADANVARKIVRAVCAGEDDIVVEIGPGFGAITLGLAEAAGHVLAVELDSGIARAFRQEYGEIAGLTLVNADILEFDLAEALRTHGGAQLLVAGNLPYGLTSPIIGVLIENRALVSRAVLMVQAEVGARLVSGPGVSDYSALSVVAQFHAVVKRLFGVRRTCFYPRPKVDSQVVELDFAARRADTSARSSVDGEAFSAVVHAAFGKRRKMLRQSMGALLDRMGVRVQDLSVESGIELSRRGETLDVAEFTTLTRALLRLSRGSTGSRDEGE
jgi:16S rRNA (adenine1518-N6/adenine1519-N6)-dimethyltransferase